MQEIFLPTQPSIFVKKTDDVSSVYSIGWKMIIISCNLQGKLDFLSYPERLCIDELHPRASMINGVLMAQCVKVGRRERVMAEEDSTAAYDLFQIEVQDNTS